MKSILFFAVASLMAHPCFANSNDGAPQPPQDSDEAIYRSLPATSEVIIGRDMNGYPIFQRSSGELTCTSRMLITPRHEAVNVYSCMRAQAPDAPSEQPSGTSPDAPPIPLPNPNPNPNPITPDEPVPGSPAIF